MHEDQGRRYCTWYQFFGVLMCLADAPYLVAQATAVALAPATRVRVAVEDATRPAGVRLRSQFIAGAVVLTSQDSLVLRPAPTASTLAIPWSSVRSIEVSRGVSRWSSALGYANEAALFGGGFYALVYATSGDGRPGTFGVSSVGEAAVFGAGIGAVIGATVGALLPYERWRRVALLGRMTLLPGPEGILMFASLRMP